MRKLWTILFFQQSNHLLKKLTYRIHFTISTIFQKKCWIRLCLFSKTILLLGSHLRAIHHLVFLSILDLLLLNNFLKNGNQVVVLLNFFPGFSTQFFKTKYFKLKFYIAKNIHKSWSKSSKIVDCSLTLKGLVDHFWVKIDTFSLVAKVLEGIWIWTKGDGCGVLGIECIGIRITTICTSMRFRG